MKILLISASPDLRGNCSRLADLLSEEFRLRNADVDRVILSSYHLEPCTGCLSCVSSGICSHKDDMGILEDKIFECDKMVILSPVYFGSITSYLKLFIDRCQTFWVRKNLAGQSSVCSPGREAAFICVSSQNDKKFFECARYQVGIMCNVIDCRLDKTIYLPGVEKPQDMEARGDILNEIIKFAREWNLDG